MLTANPKCTLGVMTMGEFTDLKYAWNQSVVNSKVYWVSSDGKHANANSNTLAAMNKGDVIDMSMKKGQLVVNNKKTKGHATFLLKNIGQDWYFFVVLEKQTQV